MNVEEKILKLYYPGKIIRTKTHLRFFSSVDMGSRSQIIDPGIYIIKSSKIFTSEVFTDDKRIWITLNDDWILKFALDNFASKCGMMPKINTYIEILGN